MADADPNADDALVLPGGVANPDQLRMNEPAVATAAAFFTAGKPVAAIRDGPWMLVEAGVVQGRTLTSWPSLRTDLRNAGGTYVDQEVHVDRGPNVLITSRKPDDLEAFCGDRHGVHQEVAKAGPSPVPAPQQRTPHAGAVCATP